MNTEKELEKTIENNEWKSVSNLSEMKKQFKVAAQKTHIKDQRMNIRIAKRDLEGLKTKALESGMPYQTLVASIFYSFVHENKRMKKNGQTTLQETLYFLKHTLAHPHSLTCAGCAERMAPVLAPIPLLVHTY